jgi:hypothetical protein
MTTDKEVAMLITGSAHIANFAYKAVLADKSGFVTHSRLSIHNLVDMAWPDQIGELVGLPTDMGVLCYQATRYRYIWYGKTRVENVDVRLGKRDVVECMTYYGMQ